MFFQFDKASSDTITKINRQIQSLTSSVERGRLLFVSEHDLELSDLPANVMTARSIHVKAENTNDLIQLFKNISNGWSVSASNIFLEYEIGNNFYEELTKLRAIKILFSKLKEKMGYHEASLPILVRPQATTSLDFNHQLISFTYNAMAAILSGVDFISLKQWTANEKNEARLAQNIQHMLKEESSMHCFTDALAGSFFFENTTSQIVDEVWQALQN